MALFPFTFQLSPCFGLTSQAPSRPTSYKIAGARRLGQATLSRRGSSTETGLWTQPTGPARPRGRRSQVGALGPAQQLPGWEPEARRAADCRHGSGWHWQLRWTIEVAAASGGWAGRSGLVWDADTSRRAAAFENHR
jgi:hypothetical protein